ncbi:unnamed protein product [Acanthoscelides obtectus]|uniref:Uncharacterized protein n=1 Tax=Acanthoscelides obtectus TaxID=200917 RepID=A0A9P0P9I6_ACAOB|nr:unnamed protein product [Acanthoscelides obtectus]CAK1667534.1 hypothetical protein AOBTE_LOCUS25897 [Acanthoscelides obtectus]
MRVLIVRMLSYRQRNKEAYQRKGSVPTGKAASV